MEMATMVQILCLAFSSMSPPDFYISDYRKNLACNSSKQIVKEAKSVNLEPTLIVALIFVESNWKRTVVSDANACGLTQVIPKYTGKITKKHTCAQLKVPKNSIHVGIKTLKFWVDHHKGDISRGLCGYNAGFRCHGKKPNRHGMRYARKILKLKSKIDLLIKNTEIENTKNDF